MPDPTPLLDHLTLPRPELARRVGRPEQLAGVRLLTLADGAERGVRVLEFRTGSGFAFEVLVDRAFDLGHAECSGRSLAWLSPVGVQGPWYAEPTGLGFLRTFGGGLLTTGGLDHTLFPTEDSALQYAYPPKSTEHYGLHGRLSTRPARLVGYGDRWDEGTRVLWAEGEVTQASSLGEHLVLRRRVEAPVGGRHLILTDTVENAGYHPTPHMLLYHVNVGYPVVDEGARILVEGGVEPVGEAPLVGWQDLTAPQPAMQERVYQLHPHEGRDLQRAAVVNPGAGLGLAVSFRRSELPHPFVWRMLGEGNYVVALEPSTNRVAGRHDARARNELITLAPGEVRHYRLELAALVGADELQAFEAQLRAAQEQA